MFHIYVFHLAANFLIDNLIQPWLPSSITVLSSQIIPKNTLSRLNQATSWVEQGLIYIRPLLTIRPLRLHYTRL